MQIADQIKKYYYNVDGVRYLLYIFLAILFGLVFYQLIYKRESKLPAEQMYPAKEANQGVAISRRHFYAIGNKHIGKYSRKTGKHILSKKLPFRDVSGGQIVNGDLVILNNPKGQPDKNALVWLDANSLEIIDIMKLPHMKGRLTWLDWAWDKWWVCDVAKGTTLYCYNSEWQLEGYWKLPKKLVNKLDVQSLAGGSWMGEYLCVSGYSEPEMYILDLPTNKIHAKLLKVIPVCFDGKGFCFEKKGKKIFAWGIRADEGVVVKCDLAF